MQRYNKDLGISRHISTFARQSDQDDRLLGCPLRAFATLPTGDAATMTTMALVPAQVVLCATSQRIGSIGSQVPPGDKNWRYGLACGCLGHGHMATSSSRGAPALCGTG